ncbi:MAG: DUF2779 domain-containing protein [Erysipelotrichaceae bacterium]
MVHLKDVKKFERCQRLFYYAILEPIPSPKYLYFNYSMSDLLVEKLNFTSYGIGKVGDLLVQSLALMEQFDQLLNVRFEAHGLRVKVSAMQKSKKGWDLYFSFPQTHPKTNEAQKIADTLWVLQQCNIKISQVYLVHLNADYVRETTLDVQSLLVVGTTLYNDKKPSTKSLGKLVESRYRNLALILDEMQHVASMSMEDVSKLPCACKSRKDCPYKQYCFPVEEVENSILDLVSSKAKYALYDQGVRTLLEADPELIVHSQTQYAQWQAAKYGRHFDVVAVRAWLKNLSYPLSFLDFEWETFAFPPYRGMKVFDVICFQYSLDVQATDQSLQHFEFLESEDCREQFVVRLLEDLPSEGSIIVFNAAGGERLRLQQLAQQFPNYAVPLQQVIERIVDLADLFSQGFVYDSKMAGSFTLKTIVKTFTQFNYDDLAIQHGMNAVYAFREINTLELEKQKQLRNELLAYCAMDTLALVYVLSFLRDEAGHRSEM